MATALGRVELAGITKTFPGGVRAVDGVSCEFAGGEIHALLGQNGAGKTTLMRILTGYYQPDSGSIGLDGATVAFQGPKDARRAGIAMVHQRFSLIPELTVAENLALGSSEVSRIFDPLEWIEYLETRSEELGFELRPRALVRNISMGERQRLEILRLVLEGAKVLVLDEPTSILAPAEAERLFGYLREFAKAGQVVILVTHKLDHVLAVADRVTILHKGSVATNRDMLGLGAAELAELLHGPGESAASENEDRQLPLLSETTVLDARLDVVPPTASPSGLANVSITIQGGELVGVAGISGNGQDELVAALVGLCLYEGSVEFPCSANRQKGRPQVAYVPADRYGLGAAPSLRMKDNLELRNYASPPFSKHSFLIGRQLGKDADEKIRRFRINPPNPEMLAGNLSGGNLQKLILARELSYSADLIIAEQPTAGLDLATSAFVKEKLVAAARSGSGVLIVSEDLDDLLAMCHRIIVVHQGRIAAEYPAKQEHRQRISLAMSGLLPSANE